MSESVFAHPWEVWHIPECEYTSDWHGKFVVAAYRREDGGRWCFFINSDIAVHPEYRDSHVLIWEGTYQFLSKTCYAACFEMYEFPASRFIHKNYRGKLEREMSEKMRERACTCRLLRVEHKKNLGCPPDSFARRRRGAANRRHNTRRNSGGN